MKCNEDRELCSKDEAKFLEIFSRVLHHETLHNDVNFRTDIEKR